MSNTKIKSSRRFSQNIASCKLGCPRNETSNGVTIITYNSATTCATRPMMMCACLTGRVCTNRYDVPQLHKVRARGYKAHWGNGISEIGALGCVGTQAWSSSWSRTSLVLLTAGLQTERSYSAACQRRMATTCSSGKTLESIVPILAHS